MICLSLLPFLICSNCVVFHFNHALSRQLGTETKQAGIGNSIRINVSHVLSIKEGTQTCANWLIRYIMQNVGLKYIHLSTDYDTNIQTLIEACERHMAKETKESSAKFNIEVSIDKELVNQNQIMSKKGDNNSKSDFIPLQYPLQNSPPWLHSKTPLHKLHSAPVCVGPG